MSTRIPVDTAADVTIGTAATTVLDILCNGEAGWLDLEINNTGSTALTDLVLQGKENDNAALKDRVKGSSWGTATNDYSAPVGTPNTLAGGASAAIRYRCGGLAAIRITAKVGSGTTTVNAHGACSLSG